MNGLHLQDRVIELPKLCKTRGARRKEGTTKSAAERSEPERLAEIASLDALETGPEANSLPQAARRGCAEAQSKVHELP